MISVPLHCSTNQCAINVQLITLIIVNQTLTDVTIKLKQLKLHIFSTSISWVIIPSEIIGCSGLRHALEVLGNDVVNELKHVEEAV